MRRSERKPASTCFLLQGIAKIVATDLMCLSRIRVHVFLITLLALFLPSLACGQAATSVNNSESTPVPGVGHNYINFLSETVDPGNGSLNVQIQVPVPPSRSLTIPFSIAYDSNGNFHIQDSNPPGSVTGATDASYVSSNGWSYSAPLLSYYNTYNSAKWKIQNGFQIYSTCEYLGDFIFTDPSGGRHSLYLAYLLPNQTNFCNQPTTPTSSSLSDTGVEGGYTAYMVIANGSSGQVYVASPDGTVYVFDVNTFNMPQLNGDGTPQTPPTTSYSLPSSIEDRNGNLTNVVASGPNTNYDATSTPIWFPLAYTDSAGRPAVSTSGFGANGNTVTVSGISIPYTVSWGTNPFSDSPSYTLGTQKIDTLSACPTSLADPATGSGSGVSAVTSITLPNTRSYQIFYDSTSGRVGKIIYPTGGWVQYVWGPNRLSDVVLFPSSQVNPVTGPLCEDRYDTVAVIHRYVSYDGTTIALQQDFSYSTTWDTNIPFTWDSKQTIVTTHDLVAGITYQTVYNYSSSNQQNPPNDHSSFAAQLPIEQSIIYKAPNGTVLRTEYKSWRTRSLLASSCQTLDNNMTSGVFYAYSAGDQLADKKEYDFGVVQPGVCTIPSATPTRETVINYQSFANTPIYTNGPSIFDRPSTVVIKDANGNTAAETDYSYDQASVGSASATDHDETNYSASSGAPRGNATTVTRKCLQSCTNQAATYTFDETGQVTKMTDPNGNVTQYSYTDNYTSGTPPGNTNAYLTQVIMPVTNGVSHIGNFSYGYADGQLTQSKDQNSQITRYTYADSLGRLTETDYPDGGQVLVSYNDVPPAPSITTQKLIKSGQYMTAVSVMDGMGHVTDSELTSDPQGVDQALTSYDGIGHPRTVTNPYRSMSDPTYGVTTYTYDALGRTTQIGEADGSLVNTSYSGNCTTVVDEQSKNRESCSDGLGRLTSVIENPGGLGYTTNYTYDALDDLTSVVQNGSRSRSFVYNSLSELTGATNPESGTVNYVYDADGNLITKADARGLPVSYCYDALNRVQLKAYTSVTTCPSPVATYSYDQSSANGLTITNGIGRRTSMTDAAGNEAWSYDSMGRALTDKRTTNSVTKSIAYTYLPYVDGSIGNVTYPSGLSLTYTYDGAGRPSSATDQHGTKYANAATYAPPGELQTATMNATSNFAGFTVVNSYTKRLQPNELKISSSAGTAMDFSYCFYAPSGGTCPSTGTTDNGNVMAIINNMDGTRSQTFGYDALNRISTGASLNTSGTNCWGEQYGYDAWGNLRTISLPSGYSGCAQPDNLNVSVSTQNQIAGYTYDAAGNVSVIPGTGGGTYTYNAENQMTTTAGITYTYDGDGKRVEKSNGTLYWYGAGSDALEETNLTGGWLRDYVFFDGTRIAARTPTSTILAFFDDHLGSTRKLEEISSTGSVTLGYDADYYPFGRAHSFLDSYDPGFKFTGKERDSESNLDNFGARYFGSSMGRFMSPDPDNAGADPTGPQSWNMYSYVSNNPLNAVDPTGLDCVYLNSAGDAVDHVLTGGNPDCTSDTDSGYYVNGTVDQSSISFGSGYMAYQYTAAPDSPNGSMPKPQLGAACVDTCPGTSVTVNASVGPDTPTMSADPSRSLFLPLQFSFTPMTNPWERFFNTAACGLGLDPALAGPMLNSGTPNQDPGNSTRETEGQTRAQIIQSNGKPDKYGNGRLKSLNPQGNRNAGTASAAAGAATLAANALRCAANARQQ